MLPVAKSAHINNEIKIKDTCTQTDTLTHRIYTHLVSPETIVHSIIGTLIQDFSNGCNEKWDYLLLLLPLYTHHLFLQYSAPV